MIPHQKETEPIYYGVLVGGTIGALVDRIVPMGVHVGVTMGVLVGGTIGVLVGGNIGVLISCTIGVLVVGAESLRLHQRPLPCPGRLSRHQRGHGGI